MAEMFNPSQSLALQNPDVLELNRQRKLADLLVSHGSQTPQGQTVAGGVYVPPNPMEYLGNLFNVYAGTKANEKLDAKEIALAQKLRDQEFKDLTKFSELQYGTPDQMVQQAGPTPEGGNIPSQMVQGQAPNPMAAFQVAAQSQSPLVRSQLAEMLKGQKLAEGEVMQRYNPATGRMETTGKGNEKYHAPISIDTGNSTILLDAITKQKIAEYPKAHQPVAGQVLETPQGAVLVDPRSGKVTPLSINGEPVLGKGNLTESQGKAAVFHSQMVSASNELGNVYSKGFNPNSPAAQAQTSMAGGFLNAITPAEAQQAKQAQNQWTEAYLRFKTGAGTNAHEVEANRQTYFPQIGDKPDQIAQKSRMRAQAEQDIAMAAGPQGGRLGAQSTMPSTVATPSAKPESKNATPSLWGQATVVGK